jgi:hypothetical protein
VRTEVEVLSAEEQPRLGNDFIFRVTCVLDTSRYFHVSNENRRPFLFLNDAGNAHAEHCAC